MSVELVEKLVQSFDDLENCIEVTKQVLRQKTGVPADVVARVDQYSEVVAKQRVLASDLQHFIDQQNWEEVGRHIKIINGLSAMIREDAQAILSGSMNDVGSSLEEGKSEDVLI